MSNSAGQGALTGLFVGPLDCVDGLGNHTYDVTIMSSGPILASVNGGSYSLSSTTGLRIGAPANAVGIHSVSTATNPAPFTAPYTNGTTAFNGLNPSKWTFSNTLVGYITDGPSPLVQALYLTGTFKLGYNTTPLTLL